MSTPLGFAQNPIHDMMPQPPDVATFSKLGYYPVSYYTGTPDISIPLFTIREKDIEIPLILQYNGSGVRVADESSWVGLGWNLLPGGYISRIVNGSKNDSHDSEFYNALKDIWTPGIDFYYLRDNLCPYYLIESEITELKGGYFFDRIVEMPFCNSFMEYWSTSSDFFQPDLYTFNFLGYSGKFFINPETNQVVILEKKDHLLFEKDNANWNPEEDGWKVTLPNGVIVFLQDIEKVNTTLEGCSSGDPSITWKISSIELLNGEEITFSYDNIIYQTASISNVDVHSFEDDEDYQWNNSTYNREYFECPYLILDCNYDKMPLPVNNDLKALTQITSPKYTVTFNRVSGESKPRLQSMEIYENSDPSAKLCYLFTLEEFKKAETYWNQFGKHGSTSITGTESYFRKYKLTKVQKYAISNGVTRYDNPYELYYIENVGLPSILSFAQDYWGYYNGRHDNSGLIPDESQMYALGGQFLESTLPDRNENDDLRKRANSNRGCDSTYMVQGILNKIVYPTQGYSKFIFESHQFSLSDFPSDYLLQADEIMHVGNYYENNYSGSPNVPSKGGGLRIKEIINYERDNTFIGRKKFEYRSGLLLETPHFWRIEREPILIREPDFTMFFYKIWTASGSNYNQSFAIPNNIGYGNVQVFDVDSEFDQTGDRVNGSIIYKFYNYAPSYNPVISKTSINYFDMKNGLPTSVVYRDNAGREVKKTEYTYKKAEESMFLSMRSKLLQTSEYSKCNAFMVEYTPIRYEWWKEDSVVERSCLPDYSNSLETSVKYTYTLDDYKNLSGKSTWNSNGKMQTVKFRYPQDINYGVYSGMADKKMVDRVIEKTESIDNSITSAQLNQYYINNYNDYVPNSMYALEAETPLPSFSGYHYEAGYLLKDPHYGETPAAEFLDYDEEANVIKAKEKNGIYSYYLWGYNKKYIVAKIESATNTTISVTVNDNNLSKSDEFNAIKNDVLYLKGLLASYINNDDYMVTLYTYKPLFGMTSQTDVNGVTMYYEYDSFGRLKCAKNDDGDILQRFDYHYADQN